jgi:thiol-disulfide isomerase/thioredoxin
LSGYDQARYYCEIGRLFRKSFVVFFVDEVERTLAMDLLLFTTTAASYVWYAQTYERARSQVHEKDMTNEASKKTVSQAPVLALFFSAGWCPDCVAFLPLIEAFAQSQPENLVRVVYVSSDESEAAMEAFKPKNFAFVPFDNTQERSNMKRHYGACARKEMADLEITAEQRKHGIPAVILIEAQTGKILHESGAEDLETMTVENAFAKWKGKLPQT